MPWTPEVFLCAAAGALLWTCIGLALAHRLALAPSLTWGLAPALGWAVYNAAALPILLLVGFGAPTVAALSGATLTVSFASLAPSVFPRHPAEPESLGIPGWALGAAALLAMAPAIAVEPKWVAEGAILSAPIFDHAKVAIIDEIARSGLPPGNPFYGEMGEPSRLAYYYLWHFSAAQLALLPGASGWEADIALTWFTAVASLACMMGLAVWFSGRASAAIWVVLLSTAASLRPVLTAVVGPETLDGLLSRYPGLGTWVTQATWSPQHLAAASCVVLACVLIWQLAHRPRPPPSLVPVLALVAAAGLGSSAWVGGVVFAIAATLVGLVLLARTAPNRRPAFLAGTAGAVALGAALAFPLLGGQYAATVMRSGLPVGFHPYEVLGTFVPEDWRRLADLPAYWLILLIVDLPAIYVAGLFAIGRATTTRAGEPGRKLLALIFAILTLVSFAVPWLLISTLLNNDLGWRGILPGVLVLTILAAAGLSKWLVTPAPLRAAAALALLALGLPHGLELMHGYAAGRSTPSAAIFAETPELWEAVRRHTAPGDRVANNPLFLREMTPWPINISWALLSDRRSCYAGWELVRPFTPLTHARVDEIDAQFVRVFAGEGSPDDIRGLATDHGCRLVVVAAADGTWNRDGFAASLYYRLVEERADAWRIYVAASASSGVSGAAGGAPAPLRRDGSVHRFSAALVAR